MSFLDVLDAIDATSSRTEKEKLLRSVINDMHVQRIFLYALNPYKTYYVQKIKPPSKGIKKVGTAKTGDLVSLGFVHVERSSEAHFEEFFSLLDKLSTRELSGNAARLALDDQLAGMTEQEQKWAIRIVTKKLRCGVSEETVEKLWPGMVPRFDVQLAESVEFIQASRIEDLRPVTPLQYPLWADAKLDGLRCVAMIYGDGTVEMRSRNGQLYEDFPTIEAALKTLVGVQAVLDCEVLGADWNETQSVAFSSKHKKDDSNLRLHVFDAVSIDEWRARVSSVRYADRLAWVHRLVEVANSSKIVTVPGRIVSSEAEMLAFFVECLNAGYEGIMLKNLDAAYRWDRSTAVQKCKPVSTHEGKIAGFFEGKAGGKRASKLGGFLVKLPNGSLTRVGGGFKDAQLDEFWQRGEAAMRGLIVEVRGQFLTEEGKIRFPRFVRFRDAADVAHEVNAIELEAADED